MSNFKDWLYRETLKIAELRKVYYDLHETSNKIDKLATCERMKNVDMHIYRACCAVSMHMLAMEEDLKEACAKHLMRIKRSEINENK